MRLLYLAATRYYEPKWGRWISPDSVDYLDPTAMHGLNLYWYCENDPINKYDTSGHIAIGLIIGAVIGAGIGLWNCSIY